MSRYPEAQTHQRTHHLTQLMPRRQERGSADAGFLRRAGGTAPLLPTKLGSQAEACLATPLHCKLHRLMQLGLSRVEQDQSDERSKASRTARLAAALRLRGTRRLILDAGKTPDWAGATPLLAKGLWPKDHRGRSSPVLDRDKGSA